MLDLLDQALSKLRSGVDLCMVTVVDATGSVPGPVGSRMLVLADATWGTIGGGALEKEAVEEARAVLEEGGPARLVEKRTVDLDMSCGGTAVLFVEPLRAAPHLWIFGAGHIAAALAPLAASVGFRAVVVDDRPAFADPARFPEATRVVCGEWAELARGVDPGSFVAIATHGHEHDEEVLAEVAAIEPALPYIGMIGSRGKVPGILARLRARGISVGENVFSPIGLDLGGGSPAEIAISIASEILGVLHGKAGLPHCRLRLDRQEDREG